MEADQALDVVLDDSAWIYQIFPAYGTYGSGFSHFFGGIFRSKSGLLKSAVAVAVCSALLLALRRCYRKYRHQHYQHRQILSVPATQHVTTTPSAAQNKPRARRNLRMTVVPSPLPEAKTTPSPTADISGKRSSSRASRMATVKFTDSDSEDEQNPVANGRVPSKIEYTPVMDEVEAEADDESSEQEDDESATEIPDQNSAEDIVEGNELVVEDQHSQDSAEVLEFNLAFETNSDSSHSIEFEPEDHKPVTAAVNGHAIMNISDAHLSNHGDRDVAEDAGQTSLKTMDAAQRRKSSLEQLNSSSMENGVVVTKAIVSIG